MQKMCNEKKGTTTMTTSAELKEILGVPALARLQSIHTGLKIGKVFGHNIVFIPAEPKTKIDELEEKVRRGEVGGLVLPEQTKKDYTPKPSTGVVLRCGPAVTSIHPGDAIMFDRHAMSEILLDGQKYGIISDQHVFLTLSEEDK